MQLRNHPLMRHRGYPNWPPVWVEMGSMNSFRAEAGTLQEIRKAEVLLDKFFLVIEYDGIKYIGCLAFDNRDFCWSMHKLLQGYVGYTVESIGNLDISYAL
jgi:hypothetical protein